jgi:hypothetical protein
MTSGKQNKKETQKFPTEALKKNQQQQDLAEQRTKNDRKCAQ